MVHLPSGCTCQYADPSLDLGGKTIAGLSATSQNNGKQNHGELYNYFDQFKVLAVPAGSPSRGGDVTVYVWLINQPRLSTPFYFALASIRSLWPFQLYFLFHQFSRQVSVFSLCSSGLISALLVLSTIYLFMKVSFSPDIISSGWLTGLKTPIN